MKLEQCQALPAAKSANQLVANPSLGQLDVNVDNADKVHFQV